MNGRGAVCGREHAWQGACVIGEMATTADGTHPTGMPSSCDYDCNSSRLRNRRCCDIGQTRHYSPE